MAETTLKQAEKLLIDAIRNLKRKRDLQNFLSDLLTPEELLDLGQRLRIAKLILAGKTYEEIAEKANVSTTTVSKVGQTLKYGSGGLERAMKEKKRSRSKRKYRNKTDERRTKKI